MRCYPFDKLRAFGRLGDLSSPGLEADEIREEAQFSVRWLPDQLPGPQK
jgi:hypothetical protein